MHRLGKAPGLAEVGGRGLAPQDVGVRGVGDGPGNGGLDASPDAEESLRGPLAREKRPVGRVDVAGEQVRPEGVGPGDDQGRHAGDVGRQAGCLQGADVLGGRDEDLAAHVAALLF